MKTCPSCGNRKVHGLICLNCGYDFKTKKSPMTPAELTGINTEDQKADIWLGSFTSKQDFETYFAEYEEYGEGEPISPFAKEQRLPFYDHDFFVAKFFSRTNDLGKVLSEVIVYNDRAEAIVANNQEAGIGIFNFIAMQLEELSPPRSLIQ